MPLTTCGKKKRTYVHGEDERTTENSDRGDIKKKLHNSAHKIEKAITGR
jgi:hypothetical protein